MTFDETLFHAAECQAAFRAEWGEEAAAEALQDADQLALWRSLGQCVQCGQPLPQPLRHPVYILGAARTPERYYGFNSRVVETHGGVNIIGCEREHWSWQAYRLASGSYDIAFGELWESLEECRIKALELADFIQ